MHERQESLHHERRRTNVLIFKMSALAGASCGVLLIAALIYTLAHLRFRLISDEILFGGRAGRANLLALIP